MTLLQKEMYFKTFRNAIYGKARKFSKIYGVEFSECLGEAFVIFAETCNRFNENLACFHTYLTERLEHKLNNFCKKMLKHGIVQNWPQNILYNYKSYNDTHESLIELKSELERLSSLAKKIINLVFNPAHIPLGKHNTSMWATKITKKSIENYLMGHGYTQRSIRNAFYEIQGAIC